MIAGSYGGALSRALRDQSCNAMQNSPRVVSAVSAQSWCQRHRLTQKCDVFSNSEVLCQSLFPLAAYGYTESENSLAAICQAQSAASALKQLKQWKQFVQAPQYDGMVFYIRANCLLARR
jgi:hypothetical protein